MSMEEDQIMELNQDLKPSKSFIKLNPEPGSLKVKLKMPKEELFLHHEIVKNNNTERACHVCHKVFSSGKALGGHMRIHHVQAKQGKDLLVSTKKSTLKSIIRQSSHELHHDDDDVQDQDQYVLSMKKPICSICGRCFPSMKSLSGHLRCHPDRAWRGIQPPDHQSGKELSSYSFSPSSSLSDAELSWSYNDDFVGVGEQRVVDLAQSLRSGWVVTARRGRKVATGVGSSSEACSNSEEDAVLLKAANDLMMLSSGIKSVEEVECEASKKAKSLRKVGVDHEVSKLKGKRKIGQCQIYEEKGSNEVEKTFKKLVCYSSDDDDDSELVSKISGDHKAVEDVKPNLMIMKNKKRSKKKVMKLCDLDQNVVTPLKNKLGAVTCDKYRCDTCDKSFPTHQALGGHMSSHNKYKLYILNSMDVKVVETEGSSSQVIYPGEVKTHRRVLDFDLNEKLPSDVEDEGGFISGNYSL